MIIFREGSFLPFLAQLIASQTSVLSSRVTFSEKPPLTSLTESNYFFTAFLVC